MPRPFRIRILSGSYPVVVPYRGDTTISELIFAGKYVDVHPHLTDSRFPNVREGIDESISVELLQFPWAQSHGIGLSGVQQRIQTFGFRTLAAAELLAIGAKYPILQYQYALVALGQAWTPSPDASFVVSLHGTHKRRRVDLQRIGYSWGDRFVIPAVRY
jgi:hypothetical protein